MPYLLSYLFAGLLIATAPLLRQKASIKQHVLRTLLVIVAWPILVLVAPEFIAASEQNQTEPNLKVDSISASLSGLAEKHATELSEQERNQLNLVANAGQRGIAFFSDSSDFEDILRKYWDESIPPEIYHQLHAARWRLSQDYEDDSGAFFSRRQPDWYIGFSTEFLKSIAGADRNKRARLLEAIGKLSEAPTTPHGDTVKPLSADLSGLWRYRLGDDRLIYKPNQVSAYSNEV